MASHRIYHPHPLEAGSLVQITGDEAHHAVRVKRLEAGEPIELLDGKGHVARAKVTRTLKLPKSDAQGPWCVEASIESIADVPVATPRIEVCVSAPKGDRLDQLIDQLAQVGADAWLPLECERSITEPSASRIDRLHRIATDSMKQCGRAWALQITDPIHFTDAIATPAGVRLIVADGSGEPFQESLTHGASTLRLIIGPEGGLSPRELSAARDAHATIARLGPHILRMETAAVLAAALCRGTRA